MSASLRSQPSLLRLLAQRFLPSLGRLEERGGASGLEGGTERLLRRSVDAVQQTELDVVRVELLRVSALGIRGLDDCRLNDLNR